MKITMVMVMSVDGRITKGDDPQIYTWTSKEDKKHFFSLLKRHSLIVMGRKTYEAARPHMRLERNTLRIVLTKHPSYYASQIVPGMLEFSAESLEELVYRLQKNRHTKMLLVGGADINALFLKADLVDELYLTIEPKILGAGRPLVAMGQLACKLTLISIKQLNRKGTVLLYYKV